ncbi:hypothetical protein Tco_1212768 [Tanacetum coccineum]
MDDPNITMEEYIKLEEEKAQRHGRTFNWQTATYGKMEYCEEEDDSLTNFETKYPAIVFDDTSNATLLCEPTIRPLNENKIDFRISFDESDDEDYMNLYVPFGIPFDPKRYYKDGVYIKNIAEAKGSETPMAQGMRQTLDDRLRMVYIGDEGHELFTNHAWRRLFEIRTPLVREFILEFFSTCRMSDTEMGLDIADTLCFQLGGAPEKVTSVDLFYLRSMDRGTANVPYLLAQYLFRHAEGRKSGARLSEGHFIGCLAAHFGLVSDQGLRGLSVVTHELSLIDLHELRRLKIYVRVGDTRAWVAPGPERQPDAAAGAPGAAEDATAVDKGAQADPAPVQAPQPPPYSPRTMQQRIYRLEEEDATRRILGFGIRCIDYMFNGPCCKEIDDMALVKRDMLTKPDKLEPRSIKCIFVGYSKETMGYSFYCPPGNKVFVARNAKFFENSLITQEASGSVGY